MEKRTLSLDISLVLPDSDIDENYNSPRERVKTSTYIL